MFAKVRWMAVAASLLALALATSGPAQERTGAWVDEVVAVQEPSRAAAVLQLRLGAYDIYASAVADPEFAAGVRASPLLAASRSFGSYAELTFNPVGPVFADGRLNPFAAPRIREAMNWLIDREHIAKEIYGGTAAPRYLPINSSFIDYARLIDVARALERRYAHDRARAERVITEEMRALGAERVGGKWQFRGRPVEIIFVIRTEDLRRAVGDYVSGLLEATGFTVTRLYRTAAEAGPIWLTGKPADGRFHIVTGGWITTVVSRDEAGNFNFFYTPRGLARPLWQAYTPSKEFDAAADRLGRRDFTTMAERAKLFASALELAMQDSVRVWTVDSLGLTAQRTEVKVAADLAGAVAGSWLWPHTVRRGERVGGRVTVALPSILPSPWNPVGGSNWIFDMMLIRATADVPTLSDPHTGLHWPQRLERAEVFIEEGLPVGVTHDWVKLEFRPKIPVPVDAWSDWDPVKQRWITVAERFPAGVTAKRMVRLHYPKELFARSAWHDGSPLSMGDFVLAWILDFDRAKEASPIFDRAEVPAFETFMRTFRGLRIVSQSPLIVEFYSDAFFLDAEINASTAAWSFWPWYPQGQGAWHNLALGVLAEARKELGFTASQADRLKVENTSFIAGPSIAILDRHLTRAAAEGHLPYEAAMRPFVTPAEVRQRYENLRAWRADKGHFWVGLGPFYLAAVFPIEKTVHLRRFAAFPDPAGKWDRFETPRVAAVEVAGPARVTIGREAVFDVRVSFRDKPYAAADIQSVKYLIFDPTGALALTGEATLVADGHYRVALSAAATGRLPVGANLLEVAVVPSAVSITTFETLEFVTTR